MGTLQLLFIGLLAFIIIINDINYPPRKVYFGNKSYRGHSKVHWTNSFTYKRPCKEKDPAGESPHTIEEEFKKGPGKRKKEMD